MDDHTLDAWTDAAGRLISKASEGSFSDRDLVSWSNTLRCPLAVILHYPPRRGTPDHGTTLNIRNKCIKLIHDKFGDLSDTFMMDLVPLRSQRPTDLPYTDSRVCQPYLSQFGYSVWSECLDILKSVLTKIHAKVVVCFGRQVSVVVKWMYPDYKRLKFGDQTLFGSFDHVLVAYSSPGVIDRIFVICFHPGMSTHQTLTCHAYFDTSSHRGTFLSHESRQTIDVRQHAQLGLYPGGQRQLPLNHVPGYWKTFSAQVDPSSIPWHLILERSDSLLRSAVHITPYAEVRDQVQYRNRCRLHSGCFCTFLCQLYQIF